ncbi:histidine phosphatase family protein [Pontibacter sp. E15-1]|uniref:SixA phosphatase family protein n=1 Tax=Pontibacter sp. E15-1 TaxID=2919918 RepID=UPI001F4F584E|nr:histidine phosphatase family protein [Pontibacter sp. E15-1]MCJ8165362.1 histidine phosphatase family protein [Pontibacter sp. E15-1]
MKLHLLLKLCFALLLMLSVACRSNPANEAMAAESGQGAIASPTVIYVVRHAEKDVSDPKNEDPGLTPAGVERAEALRATLQGQEVGALYTTKYIRTQNTLKPLAEARQLALEEYEAHDFNSLKEKILEKHRGETVVIAGHSNTVLPIVEAFGANRPVPTILDSSYDFLFKLTVPATGAPTVETSHFGAASK